MSTSPPKPPYGLSLHFQGIIPQTIQRPLTAEGSVLYVIFALEPSFSWNIKELPKSLSSAIHSFFIDLQLKIVKKMSKEDKKAEESIFYIIFDLRPLLFN